MRVLSTTLVLVVGVIHLLPVSGALSAGRLRALYGVSVTDASLLILMRHRAVLFGIVGGLLVASALRPSLRPVGLAVGLVSTLSFVLLASLGGGYNAELGRVVAVDLAASGALVVVAVLDRLARSRAPA